MTLWFANLGIVIGIGISDILTTRFIGIRAGECLTDIPTGATRIGDILGTDTIITITIPVSMKDTTVITITDTVIITVSTVITQWNTTEYTDTAAERIITILTDTETA